MIFSRVISLEERSLNQKPKKRVLHPNHRTRTSTTTRTRKSEKKTNSKELKNLPPKLHARQTQTCSVSTPPRRDTSAALSQHLHVRGETDLLCLLNPTGAIAPHDHLHLLVRRFPPPTTKSSCFPKLNCPISEEVKHDFSISADVTTVRGG